MTLADRFPEDVARWRSGDVDFQIPGGESRRQLAERGRHVLQSLSSRSVKSMIVVAHGGVLTAALGLLVGRDHSLLAEVAERPFTRLPALGKLFSIPAQNGQAPALLSFNETDHLG